MKRLLIASMLVSGAFAQSVDDRVEALEYKSYEDFFKMSGQLEYRFDKYERDDKTAFTDYYVKAGTPTARTNSVAKKSNSLNKVFLKVDMASMPTDKLSFYGRLGMRKYFNTFTSSNGTAAATNDTGDFGGSTPVGDDKIVVERAFANYVFNKRFTLSFGRLPTSQGAPYSFSRDETQGGNYPFLLYSSYLDGVAGTFSVGNGHTIKLVYTPFSTVDYSDSLAVKTSTAYVAMYELKKSFSWVDQFNFTFGHLHINKFTFASAVANIDRFMINTEMLGVAGTGLDVNLMLSHNKVENLSVQSGALLGIAAAGNLGWASDKVGKTDGNAWGIALRYSVMPTTKVGVEYFTADDEAWVTQSATDDPFNFYSNHGDAWRVFVNHSFDQAFKINVGYTTTQQDSQFNFANLLGKSVATDRKSSTIYSNFIANF